MNATYNPDRHEIEYHDGENQTKWVLLHGIEYGKLIGQGYRAVLVQSVQGQDWAMMTREVN